MANRKKGSAERKGVPEGYVKMTVNVPEDVRTSLKHFSDIKNMNLSDLLKPYLDRAMEDYRAAMQGKKESPLSTD